MAHIVRTRHLRDLFFCLALGTVAIFLLRNPQQAIDAAKSGLQLCGNVIIPSLFPFFVLSSMIVNLGMVRYLDRLFEPVMRPLFGLSGACSTAVALGMIGGYPVGARTALSLCESGQITQEEAERLLAFCNNCGPAFIFGVVGAGVFSSGSVGLLLYLIHIAASILIGIGFHLFGRPVKCSPQHGARRPVSAQHFPAAFTNAVRDGCSATLNICAFIICFTIIIRFVFLSGAMDAISNFAAALLQPLGVHPSSVEALLVGMIEISSGVWGLKSAAASISSQVAMAAFILGWAGLCVHCQVLSFTGEAHLSMRPYLLGKFLHGGVSALLIWLIYRFVPLSESAANCYVNQVSTLCSVHFSTALRASTITASIVWGLVCLICLCYFRKSSGNRLRNRV